MFRPFFLVLAAFLALLGCASGNPPPSDPIEVSRAAYSDGSPPEVVLFTVRKVGTDSGAHTGLMVNGSQRVMWDPAGSFVHPSVPEVNDLLYGFSPLIERVYTDYHVRPEFYVVRQSLPVSPETAERLIAAMRSHGAAPKSTCTRSASRLLRDAGLDVDVSWFPNQLMNDFAAIPGVTSERIDVSNVDTNHNVIFGKGGVPLPPGA